MADTPGFIVLPTTGLTTTELGGKNGFSVYLNTAPTSDVTINVSSSNPNAGIVDKTSLTFTSTNFNIPQNVTIQGVNDNLNNGDVPYNIILSSAVSTDTAYNGLKPSNVNVLNLNSDRVTISPTPTPSPFPAPIFDPTSIPFSFTFDNTIIGSFANDLIGPFAGSNIIIGLTGNDTIRGSSGNDSINGNQGADDLNGGQGNDTVRGGQGNDTVRGGKGNDVLFGDADNDFMNGDAGNDTLIGINPNSFTPGRAEVDTLSGGSGSNLFVLGDSNGTYYEDGNTNNAGYSDYALILDFNSSQDFIQLKSGLNYLVGISPLGLPVNIPATSNGSPQGTGIYIDNDGISGLSSNDELIAVVQGVSLPNPIQSRFVFV